ncbi:hypothetical protein BSKO_04843 [Bryopsis sp. KO-2023]|nr:hypothetical protein BSKO_04843 [Bryopsis sp. KO-2023]
MMLFILIVWTLCYCSGATLSYGTPIGDEVMSCYRAMPKRCMLRGGQGSIVPPGSYFRRRRNAGFMWVFWSCTNFDWL